MTQRLFQLLLTLLSAALLSAAGCTGDGGELKQLAQPSPAALAAVLEFKRDFPGARVFFSQNTGEILWIDGAGSALAQGLSQTPVHALDQVHGFLERYPNLFRIVSPRQSLISADGGLNLNPAARGLTTLRFTQLQHGMPVEEQHGTAYFDGAGRLLGLQTKLLPDAQFNAAEPDAASENASGTSARLAPLPEKRADSRRGWRRLAPLVKTGAPTSPKFELIDERVERNGIEVRRILSDPRSGKILKTFDETPSELTTAPSGWTAIAPTEVDAHDSLGAALTIPSTRANGTLVLGFHLAGVHEESRAVFIADAGTQLNRARIPLEPLASSTQTWAGEPAFNPDLRAAATLAHHLRITLQWFSQELGWASWNGRGSSMYTAIRGNRKTDSKPELNAWGGGGSILIGDGLSATGQPLSDALDIVAHEFTHSLIDATAKFRYYSESGALNESLADFFGKAVQGFPDTIEGSQAGAHFRDLADPEGCKAPSGEDCTQPGHYSGFEILADDDDAAGVHTNSGIMNRALTQVVLKVGGATPLAKLILDSLVFAGFDPESRLEDFAAGLSAYCRALERTQSFQAGQAGLCTQLETSFEETELLGVSY